MSRIIFDPDIAEMALVGFATFNGYGLVDHLLRPPGKWLHLAAGLGRVSQRTIFLAALSWCGGYGLLTPEPLLGRRLSALLEAK